MPADGRSGDDIDGSGTDGADEETHRPDPADAFGAVSDPTRVDILRELSDHHRASAYVDTAGPDPIGFAALRKRVGVRDSGRFRYHLNRLRDRFVEKVDGGYRLTPVGFRIVGAILAGTYTERPSMGPIDLDSSCPLCGDPVVAAVEDARCVVRCADDHLLFQWTVPPNFAAEATPEAVLELSQRLALQGIERVLAGACPHCYEPIEADILPEAPDEPQVRAVCGRCGAPTVGPLSYALLIDPDVVAFYRRHGLTLQDNHVWEFRAASDGFETAVVDEDPCRIEVAISIDDETLRVEVDDRGSVIAVDAGAER